MVGYAQLLTTGLSSSLAGFQAVIEFPPDLSMALTCAPFSYRPAAPG